jgi:Na+/melibiose symporter-like transporter
MTLASEKGVLRRSIVLTYGSIGLPLAVIGYPVAIWIPPFYAGELGVSLAVVGTMLMLARFSDVLTDPVMGDLTDRIRTRFGRRKPWLFFGVPIMMLGIFMLFMPGASVGTWYLLIWVGVMFLGATMIGLPYGAWGAELSPDYHQRSRVAAAREFFVLGGLLVAALVPAVVQYFGDATARPVLIALGWVIMGLLPVTVGLVLWRVPERVEVTQTRVPFREGLRYMWDNGPLKRILLIALIVTVGEAFRNALSLFFMRDVIGIQKIGVLYLVYFSTGLAAIPLWLSLAKRIEKHIAFSVCLATVSLVSGATFFLGQGDVVPFICLFAAKGFCFGGLQFLPIAMLADVVDVDSVHSGTSRAGSIFALSGMTHKLSGAIGTGISLNLIALAAYNPSGAAGVNGPTELWWLSFLYAIMPTVFFSSALWLTWTYPLTEERQKELRAAIEGREEELVAQVGHGN